MNIKPFKVEEWMNAYETKATWNIAETCCDSISLNELFALTGEDKAAFLDAFCDTRLTYGAIEGRPDFKAGICGLYETLSPDEIVPTHGASGANHHIFYSLVNPGDRIVTVTPTYQQLYEIPASFGADVKTLRLKPENNWLPDLDALEQMVTPETKMICINNPNNPLGSLMPRETLEKIAAIAKAADAYVLCDEVYRHLTQADDDSPSIVDLYDKGISVSSMSKVFSLAGLRLGWIATHDSAVIRACFSHRDYNLISCGMFDEAVAALALRHADAILKRNQTLVRDNLEILDAWVNDEPAVYYVKPQAGTTALIAYESDMPSYDFCEALLKQTGALVTPGDCFDEPHSFRIGYAADRETLEKGLAAISDLLNNMKENYHAATK